MTASAGTYTSDVADIHNRDNEDVWEIVATFVIISGDTTGALTIPNVNGLLQKVIVSITDETVDPQASMTIKDNGDNTIFSAGPLAENATYPYSVSEPLSGDIDIALTFTNPTSTGAIVVTMRGI